MGEEKQRKMISKQTSVLNYNALKVRLKDPLNDFTAASSDQPEGTDAPAAQEAAPEEEAAPAGETAPAEEPAPAQEAEGNYPMSPHFNSTVDADIHIYD